MTKVVDDLITENAILRELLSNIVEEYYAVDNGRTLRWSIEAAQEFFKKDAKGD